MLVVLLSAIGSKVHCQPVVRRVVFVVCFLYWLRSLMISIHDGWLFGYKAA